ncbi:MAG: hypothetical protein IJX17_00290 [Clostridia bacterium]|nr:hypothetical protein [Clostridia bacterium]
MANSQIEIKELDTRIIKYRLADKKNGAVIYYTLDLDKYQLSIQGEVSGSYKWCETPESESFLELMVRCDKWYLMNKLFNKVFDCNKSIKNVKRYIKENYRFWDKEEEKEIFNDLSEIDTNSAEMCMDKVFEVLNAHPKGWDTYEICCCMEDSYKYWDEKAISYFCNNIKPKLKKKIGENQHGAI